MPFDIRQLRHAIAAADCRSFHRAGEELAVKRSTLSRSVFHVEHCLGVKLFIRTSSGVSTTPAGDEFIREARHIVSKVDQLVQSMRAAGLGQAGALTVGHACPVSAGNLSATMSGWREHRPDIETDGVEATREDLVNGLREGAIDFAIMAGEANYPGVDRTALWSERLFLAMPADHPLAARGSVQWRDLSGETVLLTANDPGPEFRDMLLGRVSVFERRPRYNVQAVSRESIMGMVGGGLGVTIICEGAAGAQYRNVVLRELHGPQGATLVSYSGYWRKENSNLALRHFLDFVRDRYSLPVDPSRSP
ncbi:MULTISPECIES: LysR family transcriptional regulator [unclassified Ensifer]|uniref:LysR substrate-binding domain-containing protein n=1 Tax=unclassified Ensifer TaxID=2633371 RepID=UPI00301003EB